VRRLRQIADRLIGLAAILGSVGLLFEIAVILTDVVGRAMGAPLYGSQDLITSTFVIVVFGGMALCDRIGGHIAVDMLQRHYPPAMNRAIDAFSALLGAAIFAVLARAVYDSAKISVMLNLSTNLLGLPKAWFQYLLVGLSAVTALAMLLRAVELALGSRDTRGEGAAAR
jgi:TRAP-type C4-dicarboxylate transport system permease small subunit